MGRETWFDHIQLWTRIFNEHLVTVVDPGCKRIRFKTNALRVQTNLSLLKSKWGKWHVRIFEEVEVK